MFKTLNFYLDRTELAGKEEQDVKSVCHGQQQTGESIKKKAKKQAEGTGQNQAGRINR